MCVLFFGFLTFYLFRRNNRHVLPTMADVWRTRVRDKNRWSYEAIVYYKIPILQIHHAYIIIFIRFASGWSTTIIYLLRGETDQTHIKCARVTHKHAAENTTTYSMQCTCAPWCRTPFPLIVLVLCRRV